MNGRILRVAAVAAAAYLITGMAWAQEEAKADAPFPGKKTEWRGFDRFDFEVDGRNCCVVTPKTAAPGKPWIWRARFFDHRPEVDVALVEKGFHLVYIDVAALYGCAKAVGHWDAFYDYLTEKHGFNKKAVLEGMSRGGLIVYNWTAVHPDRVACIYADAPVLDIKSWPAGKGEGTGNPGCWEELKKVYGFASDEEALEYRGSPIDSVEPIAKAKIPLIHVCGDADKGVPHKENTMVFKKRYEELGGGEFELILKPGVGHKHGLDDPTPIVDFVLRHTLGKDDGGDGFSNLGPWENAGYIDTGAVRVEDGQVILETGDDMTGIRWPATPVNINYEITLDAKRVEGNDFFCGLTFPVGDTCCSLVVGGWGGTVVGLSCLDYADAYNNETARFLEFETGKWYPIRVRVTEGAIEAWIDGEKQVEVVTTDRKIDVRWEMEKCRPLGIATWRTAGAIRDVWFHKVPADSAEIEDRY